MSNKDAINLLKDKEPLYYVVYKNNNFKGINQINKDVLKDLNKMDKIPKSHKMAYLNKNLIFSLGNKKIGNDTLCISISSGLNCCMAILGYCNNCNICYAKNHNKMYFKNTVSKNLINQILINDVVLNKMDVNLLVNNTLKAINKAYSKNKVKNIKFLRFNVEGDILNNKIGFILDKIAYKMSIALNLKSCYTYTHNKNLDFKNYKNIVFNTSDFKNKHFKGCYTIFNIDSDLKAKIYNKEVILCNGDCTRCSYCKNPLETRDVLFKAHGGSFKGLNDVETDLLNFINDLKETDYKEFMAN